MAAPFVLLRTVNDVSANRVKVDVGGEFLQVLVGLDQDRLVPPLEQMAGFSLPPVEPLGIAQGYPLHDSGQRDVRYLNLQVEELVMR